jgi:hypothetical protein
MTMSKPIWYKITQHQAITKSGCGHQDLTWGGADLVSLRYTAAAMLTDLYSFETTDLQYSLTIESHWA